jgi:hypothetical protein
MNWQKYEKEVFENLSANYPDAQLEFNSKLFGKYSQGLRQCDVIIKQIIEGVEYLTLVDAKYYSKKIDVKAVENFISMANDINADHGILVTPLGYSELAYNRAENDPTTILLDILNFDEFRQFQGDCAIPYSGKNGVILTPAFGWVIDAAQNHGMIASIYRKGLDFNMAFKEKEFIYFHFWNTIKDPLTPEKLLSNQQELIAETSTILESEIETIQFNSKILTLRKTIAENYLAVEYACAIEFDDFIFFCILICPSNRESVNKITELPT